ncbi:zinc finger and SCAN domain-containing protein 22-like isoform X2 [Mercenaria mercenaria]|uniref:zinc finger and SCAN domain-containing protein 22-like isoform X2 n=1 Tax=Mercenaria mercenaria TaxID=6596 RepID=UPI00234E4909|nr:zinc finger and SCAN domain-containing protein 22-like isoform X2 [Mercenaria mercenaria]
MDSYLMMLYVSLDQERAMRKLFSDNGWKYYKPDLLQLTDELGGVIASNMYAETNSDKIRGFTSPSKSGQTNITSPSRPATRSQKSSKNTSLVKNATNKRKIRSPGKKTDSSGVQEVTVIKEESVEVVDDDDLNDYMEHGDEDDDYIDDDEKDVKRKVRRLTKTSETDHSTVEKEDVTSKLDGTEDTDPEDSTFMSENAQNSPLEQVSVGSKVIKAGYRSMFATADTSSESSNTATSKWTCVTEDDLDSDPEWKTESVAPGRLLSDLKKSDTKMLVSNTLTQVRSNFVSDKQYLTDAWCLEKEKGKVLMKSLRHKKPARMKVAGEKHEESQNIYVCDDCGKVYAQKSSWKRHLKSHKPGIQHCGQCNMYFDSVDQLESHNDKFHSIRYVCTVCEAGFSRKSCLRKHMLRVHPEHCTAKFSCSRPSCNAVFDSEELYNDHLNIHEGRKPHQCCQCSRSFSTKSSLRLHENNHNVDNSVQCEDCGRKFSSPGALHNHKVSVHENKRFKCDQCEKVFIYRSGYCKHLLSHKKEKSETKAALTCSVISDLKSDDGNINKNDEVNKEDVSAVDQTGTVVAAESNDQKEQNQTNQVDQIAVVENQSVESLNQVETVVSGLSNVGVSQLQSAVLAGQEVTGLPLTTVQLDPSTRVMWICRT